MSFWEAEVAIIKIKEEYREEFEALYNGEYEKVENEEFKLCIDDVLLKKKEKDGYVFKDILSNHDEWYKKWSKEFPTHYENGFFIYGYLWNLYNYEANCIAGCLGDIIWDNDVIFHEGIDEESNGGVEDNISSFYKSCKTTSEKTEFLKILQIAGLTDRAEALLSEGIT